MNIRHDDPEVNPEVTQSGDACGDPGCRHDHADARVPIRVEPKIGRNQACPCGSGAKFKKCCGK